MKNKYTILLILLLVSNPILRLLGQEINNDRNHEVKAENLHEKLVIVTDRTLYSIEETICFNASYFTNKELTKYDWEARKLVPYEWSTILYIELIKADGTSIVKNKYPIEKNEASGEIQIPENLLSGIYYLKSYTKWMRNFPTTSYAYNQLKIVNPINSDIEKTNTNNQKLISLENKQKQSLDIAISCDKQKYKTREEVTISINTKSTKALDYNYSVSVVKRGSLDTSYPQHSVNSSIPENEVAKFYPEINGISVSGRVINTQTKLPVEGALVNLSLLTKQSFMSVFNTNRKGEFFFAFPDYENAQDLFITAQKDDVDLSIEIDKDFCQKPLSINAPIFSLNEKEKLLAKEFFANTQISKSYIAKQVIKLEEKDTIEYSFYGIPEKVLHTKDYIDLPFLEEFIFELIPNITVIHKKNAPSIYSSKQNTFVSYPFLVLVDNVPTTDLEAFLKIRTNKIDRIEYIDKGYVLGDIKYSGIISAFSKEKDMAGIELPKNSMFLSYDMLTEIKKPSFELADKLSNKRIPDRRNCLYWNSEFQLVPEDKNSFSFYTSDSKGEYQVIIQAVSKKDGEIFITVKDFLVE